MAQIKRLKWLICGSAISLLMLPGTAPAHGVGEGATVKVGEYQISLVFAEPAKTGGNPLHVHILNGKGMPVKDARVDISAMPIEDWRQHRKSMESGAPAMSGMHGMNHVPAMASANDMPDMPGMSHAPATARANDMPGMGRMDTASTLAQSNELPGMEGDYVGAVTFAAAGHWILNTHLSINGQMLNADFPVDVAKDSTSFAILTGFAGLNALIIWVASQNKRKAVFAEPAGEVI